MTFRTNLLPTVTKLRELPGPTNFDIYTSTVVLRTRVWSGGQAKLGTPTDTDVTLFPRPKVRELSGTEIEVGPITPSNSGGGYTAVQLNPADVAGTEFYYVVTGPDGVARPYHLTEMSTAKAFRYMLRMVAIDRKTPF